MSLDVRDDLWPRGTKRDHPLYLRYSNMLDRCYNTKTREHHRYGGRGITVCDRWRGKDGFANYVTDVGVPPTPKHTIDRIDNDKGYSPENVRWATMLQQNANRRNTSKEHMGIHMHTDGHWQASIRYNAKHYYLGVHKNMEDAMAARKQAEAIIEKIDATTLEGQLELAITLPRTTRGKLNKVLEITRQAELQGLKYAYDKWPNPSAVEKRIKALEDKLGGHNE